MGKQITKIALVIIFQIVSINLVAAYFVNNNSVDVKNIQSSDMVIKDGNKSLIVKKHKLKKGFTRSYNPMLD